MISLATVFVEKTTEYQQVFLRSVLEKTELVSEVMICCVERPSDFREEWTERGIRFVKFGPSASYAYKPISYHGPSMQHGLGIHACIDAASNDYIFCSDPDVFFYSAVDKIYHNTMDKYKLNYIGCGRHSAGNDCCYGYFPYIHNCMVRRSDLPGPNFMAGEYTRRRVEKDIIYHPETGPEVFPGKFLFPMRIEAYDHYFPYPDRAFDTAMYLYVWAKQKDWRWLSFLTSDRFNYTTQYIRTSDNLKIKERLPFHKLIYHQGDTTWHYPAGLKEFLEAYKSSQRDPTELDD